MRKGLFLTGLLCACVMCMTACDVSEMGTLSDLSKPYTGFYECESIYLGGDDYTEHFDDLRLELGYDGKFELSYRDKNGGKGSYRGTYSADPEAGEITFSAQMGLARKSFTFPMEKGKIYVDYMLRGKLLHAVFAAP